MIYFDTSVLAAYYTPEERSAEAAAIVAKASYPVVSDLAAAEQSDGLRATLPRYAA